MASSSVYSRAEKKVEVVQMNGGILMTKTTDTITENIHEASIDVPRPHSGYDAGNTRRRQSASSRTICQVHRFAPYNLERRLRRGERIVLYASTSITASQVFIERVE